MIDLTAAPETQRSPTVCEINGANEPPTKAKVEHEESATNGGQKSMAPVLTLNKTYEGHSNHN